MPAPLYIFAWLALQTCAILLAALRIPLWAHASAVGEFLALPILLTIQILAASLLFSRLTDDWRSTVVTIAAAWPFVVTSGFLSVSSISTILYSGALISSWITVLWIWRSALSSSLRSQFILSAFAAGWAAAGPVLLFIRIEYSPTPPAPLGAAPTALLGPLVNALTSANNGESRANSAFWITLAGLAALGGVVGWGKKVLFARFRSIPEHVN